MMCRGDGSPLVQLLRTVESLKLSLLTLDSNFLVAAHLHKVYKRRSLIPPCGTCVWRHGCSARRRRRSLVGRSDGGRFGGAGCHDLLATPQVSGRCNECLCVIRPTCIGFRLTVQFASRYAAVQCCDATSLRCLPAPFNYEQPAAAGESAQRRERSTRQREPKPALSKSKSRRAGSSANTATRQSARRPVQSSRDHD
jgi:hypothetical protein